jgi:hypothetical protein
MQNARTWAVLLAALAWTFVPRAAWAQACCVGASGLTPGWLANHEKVLVGAQLRVAETHGTYPTSGGFFTSPPGKDTKVETSLFASARFLPRGQVSAFMPLSTTRRNVDGRVETGTAFGDLGITARYDFVRAGESRIPGISGLFGLMVPTGRPSDKTTGVLAADVTGIGTWEVNAGVSVEQTWNGVIAHATALGGLRTARDVFGVSQHLGPRGLFLAAAGYVFEGEVTILGTFTHIVEGDATVAGEPASGTGYRTSQLAMLVLVPLSDAWRLRTSVFTDVPPLGTNRPAMGGTSISLLRSWM